MSPTTVFTKSQAIAPIGAIYDAKLIGKSVLITGGASRIGEQVLRAFVNHGAFVTFGDIADDKELKLVSEFRKDKVAYVLCDVLCWADQLKLFKAAMQSSPSRGIGIVFANAGIAGRDGICYQYENVDGEPKEPDFGIITTNLIGSMYTAKLALSYLPKQPQGEDRDRCMIFTAGLAGYLDTENSPQYGASKWGLRGMMRSLRRSGPNQDICTNLIA